MLNLNYSATEMFSGEARRGIADSHLCGDILTIRFCCTSLLCVQPSCMRPYHFFDLHHCDVRFSLNHQCICNGSSSGLHIHPCGVPENQGPYQGPQSYITFNPKLMNHFKSQFSQY